MAHSKRKGVENDARVPKHSKSTVHVDCDKESMTNAGGLDSYVGVTKVGMMTPVKLIKAFESNQNPGIKEGNQMMLQ